MSMSEHDRVGILRGARKRHRRVHKRRTDFNRATYGRSLTAGEQRRLRWLNHLIDVAAKRLRRLEGADECPF